MKSRTFTVLLTGVPFRADVEASAARVTGAGALELVDAGGNLVQAFAFGQWSSVSGGYWHEEDHPPGPS